MAADQRGEDTAESPTVHLESGGSVDGTVVRAGSVAGRTWRRWRSEDTGQVADTLELLGQTYADLGQDEQAREVWQEALKLYDVMRGQEDCQRVQHRLDGV